MSVVILPRLVGAMEICWGAKPKVDTREHNNNDMIAFTKIASIPSSCLGHFFFCVRWSVGNKNYCSYVRD
jgi:hypothetical protein